MGLQLVYEIESELPAKLPLVVVRLCGPDETLDGAGYPPGDCVPQGSKR